MRAAIALLALLCGAARADSVGIVVASGSTLRGELETWVEVHDKKLVAAPLSPDAVRTLTDCFVIDDLRKCASGVVNARAKSDSIVFARLDGHDLTIYWFRKGHSPVVERRHCDNCATELGELVDQAMTKLAEDSALDTGFVKLRSRPAGATVLIDGASVGATPLELDLRVGSHQVALQLDGRAVGERAISIETGQEVEIMLRAEPVASRPPPSRLYPEIAIGGGAAAIVLGGILIGVAEDPTGAKPTYRNSKPFGIVLVLVGVAAAGGGGYWFYRTTDSGPVVAPTPGGAVVGWAGNF